MLEKLHWVPLGLSPYQCCCIVGCDKDAVTQFELILHLKKITLYVSSCGNETHIRDLLDIVDNSRKKDKLIGLECLQLNRLMVQPHNMNKMCRFDLWKEHTQIVNSPESAKKIIAPTLYPKILPPVATTTTTKENQEKILPINPNNKKIPVPTKPIDDWMFFEISAKHTRHTWMNLEHQVCDIYDLSDEELIDAVLSIRDINYRRIPKALRWINELEMNALSLFNITITKHYKRYTKQLNIGTVKATKKLEVFKEVALIKKLISG